MTQPRIVELWKQIETILSSTVDPLEELDRLYNYKYKHEIIAIMQKLLSVQEDLALIDMQETFKRGENR